MSPPLDTPNGSSPDARGNTWPPQIQGMIANHRRREQPADSAQVAALWKKAVLSARDAILAGMSIDGALRSAYDAGHMACLALLAANGLRPGGGQGHHEMAFAGATALGDPALADLVPDSELVRGLRRASMYDPTIADASDLQHVLDWMRRTIPAVRTALVRAEPPPAESLEPYP